jgi:hypothetical protein
LGDEFKRLQAAGFVDWRVTVDGMAARPASFSLADIITTGLVVAAGASGIAVAAKVAQYHGLIPPDAGGLYGPGETLTYAAQRLLTRHSMAREFSRSEISKDPFANEV